MDVTFASSYNPLMALQDACTDFCPQEQSIAEKFASSSDTAHNQDLYINPTDNRRSKRMRVDVSMVDHGDLSDYDAGESTPGSQSPAADEDYLAPLRTSRYSRRNAIKRS